MTAALLAALLMLRGLGVPASVETFSVSAYTNRTGAPPYQGLTASGEYTRPGVAACGPSYSFGTFLLVDAKWYVCADRGGAITDGHLDLWFQEDEGAWAWGRQTLNVLVVRN